MQAKDIFIFDLFILRKPDLGFSHLFYHFPELFQDVLSDDLAGTTDSDWARTQIYSLIH